jgi:hypothetical protein
MIALRSVLRGMGRCIAAFHAAMQHESIMPGFVRAVNREIQKFNDKIRGFCEVYNMFFISHLCRDSPPGLERVIRLVTVFAGGCKIEVAESP